MGCAAYVVGDNSYQTWTGLPDSPVSSGDYLYQAITYSGGYLLGCFTAPIIIYRVDEVLTNIYLGSSDYSNGVVYSLIDGVWKFFEASNYIIKSVGNATTAYNNVVNAIHQSNLDIYYGEILSFAKTVEPATGGIKGQRIRGTRHKAWTRDKHMQYKTADGWGRVNL